MKNHWNDDLFDGLLEKLLYHDLDRSVYGLERYTIRIT